MAASGAVWSGERTTLSPFESFSYCTGIPSPACGAFSPLAAAGFGAGALAQAAAQRSGSHRDALTGFDLPPAGRSRASFCPRLRGGAQSIQLRAGRGTRRAAVEAAPDEDGDDESDTHHHGDHDANAFDVVREGLGGAEVVAETHDDSDFDRSHRGVEAEELRGGELRGADREVDGAPQRDEEAAEEDRAEAVPLDEILPPLAHPLVDHPLSEAGLEKLREDRAAEQEARGIAHHHAE